jgi:hypothetical protein
MAKDYFQDIVPSDPHDGGRSAKRLKISSTESKGDASSERGIRNVVIPSRTRRPVGDVRSGSNHSSGPSQPTSARQPTRTRRWLWILSGVCVVVLALFLLLFVFRSTSVSVVPQSQIVTFDNTSQFTAYPASDAPSGTMSYTIQSTDIEDSAVVASTGTQHVEAKASGSITVVNNYSASTIKLIKNTRFQSAGGLIFRAPADIVIPGKSATGPGKVNVTVVADAAGAQYNIGPQTRFTVPGLQSSAAEYAAVYAMSSASTTGGLIGDQPGVAQSDLDTARSQVRASLQTKADAFASVQTSATATELTSRVTFTDEPNTVEAGNTVRIHESAHVDVVVVPEDVFASTIGQTVAADVSADSVMLVPGPGFSVTINNASPVWGSDPLTFTLAGHAQLIWKIDTKALAQALAGRNLDASQAIVSNFPGVQSGSARIEPFWESSFPSNPADIHVTVQPPKAAQ